MPSPAYLLTVDFSNSSMNPKLGAISLIKVLNSGLHEMQSLPSTQSMNIIAVPPTIDIGNRFGASCICGITVIEDCDDVSHAAISLRLQRFSGNRCIPLHKGDEVACNLTPGIDCPKLGEYWNGSQLMCVRLIRRDKWWQFWKPKYKQAVFRYMGESKVIESDIQIISSEYVK